MMAELIQQYKARLSSDDGAEYTVQAWGEREEGTTWIGWLEFHPLDDLRDVLQTDRETTQPGRRELGYWASGLELIYLQGAFERSHSVSAARSSKASV